MVGLAGDFRIPISSSKPRPVCVSNKESFFLCGCGVSQQTYQGVMMAHRSFVGPTLHAPLDDNRRREKGRRRKRRDCCRAHTHFHCSLGVPLCLQASGIEKLSCMGRASCSMMLQAG